MLKNYLINGFQFQYEEGSQPDGAIEVKAENKPSKKAEETETKAAKPANKARAVKTK